jgi:ribosomal-protein-serine acetyltransferase
MLSLTVNESIVLRTYLDDDASEHFEVVNTNRKHLRGWLRWIDGHTKEANSLDYIRYTQVQQDSQQALMMGIFEDGNFIGEVGMFLWEQDLKKAQIGYWLNKEHEGKGILQLALNRFFKYIFENLSMNKLEVRFVPSNTRSAKLAERMKCKIEGVLRASYFINGKLDDLVVTGILKEEWQATNS